MPLTNCKLASLFLFLIITNSLYAQEKATIRTDFGYNLNTNYKLKQNGNIYETGTINDFSKAKISVNVPLLKYKIFRFSVEGRYSFYHADFEKKDIFSDALTMNINNNHHVWGISTHSFFQTKLFDKPLMGNLTLMVEGSENGYERITGIAMVAMVLKRTQSTTISVGMLGMINASSPIPAFPFITVKHKFNDKWAIDMGLPQMHLQYSFNEKNRLSTGISFDGDIFFFQPQKETLPKDCLYSRLRVTPEILYERSINRNIRLFVKGGVALPIQNRIYDKKNMKDYITISEPVSGFFNVGFSYNLFK